MSPKQNSRMSQHANDGTDDGKQARLIRNAVVVVLLVGATTTVAMLSSSFPEPVSTQPEAVEAPTPAPYYYDAATNQHWDPDHGHWHPGPPPANPLGDGVPAPPNIPNPEPWQYDVASDRHYDPGHAHWHAGPPPAGVDENTLISPVGHERVSAPPGVINPQPWQYHAETDRHYHAGHRHWHAGPPPPEGQR